MTIASDSPTEQPTRRVDAMPSVGLRDGSTIVVRPVAEGDEAALLDFYRSLSPDSQQLRFFSNAADVEAAARELGAVDPSDRFGLVALAGPDAHVVAHAVYRRTAPAVAEVGFAVTDRIQGHGLGTILLGQLAQQASGRGVAAFEAVMLPSNHRMLGMLRQSGFDLDVHAGRDQMLVRFSTSLTEDALASFDHREQLATTSALKSFLSPTSIAVIGASRQRGTVGGEVFHNLISGSFNGPVHPVNARSGSVQSVAAYASVQDIPSQIDLAVVAVPCEQAIEVVDQCWTKGVRAIVLLSAGFAEAGPEGQLRQRELLAAIRSRGIRLIGPNCLGILNTDPDVRLNATFGPTAPTPGRVGFMSQSGALGLAAMDYAHSLGVGISSFVSVGNKADISGNDLLCYWESDPGTHVILLYLESFGNPRKFSRIARRVARQKPIVALKSGRSLSGARAAGSHTGALLAASDTAVNALFQQTGVIRVDTIEELFGAASLLESQPLPRGRRVGIVTNVGGPAILCADACEARGLQVPPLADETRQKLQEFLPALAATNNPVDMIASATAAQYAAAIPIVAEDPSIDAVIAIFVQPLATRPEAVATAIMDTGRLMHGSKPVLAVFMSGSDIALALQRDAYRVPWYAFPESAAIALAHAAQYAEWRLQPLSPPPTLPGLRRDEAAGIVARAMGRGPGWLSPEEVLGVLDCYEIPHVSEEHVSSPEEAARVAATIAAPYALKGVATGVVHKTDVGLVKTGVRSPSEIEDAARDMLHSAEQHAFDIQGFLIQPMVTGVEMLAGVVHDPTFGPVVACGAGGVLVEVMKDVALRLSPLTAEDASEMIRGLRSYPLLTGYRGAPPADLAAFQNVLLRLSALAEDLPQIAELDCNPLMVGQHGAVVVDARIRIDVAAPEVPLGGRY